MSGIYLKITGDPASLHDLADWLENNPSKLSEELHLSLMKLKNHSIHSWLGETGTAFRQTVGATAKGVEPVHGYSKDAASAFRAFANRITRGREKFQDYADSAKEGRLVVDGDWITMPLPPPPPGAYPAGKSAPVSSMSNGACVQVWQPGEYQKAQELFKGIAEDVGNWWTDLEKWIDEHLVPLISRVTDFDELAWVLKTLGEGNDLARNTAVGLVSAKWAENLKEFEAAAAKAREAADTHTHRRNSGDPEIRKPALKESSGDLKATRDMFDGEVRKLRIGSRTLPVVGFAVDVAAAGIDVTNGGSISSNAVGIGAGVGSSVVLGVGATAVGLSGGGVALIIGGIAFLLSETARGAYENSVPLDIREAIDAGDWNYVF
ncbi:hypothetical protein G7066_08025 [Leucobacter coleopterorum]|uniref:WXG100 family type VII secretion target n=1 Tax=Leucobacter coleopterorum TaxID=2714933 RepID=A0ABX6JW97_9MICO|nr:hypothetical protein [Leucobacter coleopterorum]QIM18581.1 hypothetical protein G7066_08025 [Leucobacter coleopterorum]